MNNAVFKETINKFNKLVFEFEFLLLLNVFFIWSIHFVGIYYHSWFYCTCITGKNYEKKKLTQVVVLWSSDSLDLKVGKDKYFMIEYNQTSSEIHINEILHVLIMPHVLMGHVCSSQYYGFDYLTESLVAWGLTQMFYVGWLYIIHTFAWWFLSLTTVRNFSGNHWSKHGRV